MEKKRFNLFLNNTKSIDIEFQNVTFTTNNGRKGKKQVIKGVSGKFLAGELTAIMGPSGAGKTTLLNILTGYQISGAKGMIKCNNSVKKITKALQYKKESVYILQDDNLPPLFTVLELMNLSVDLKLRDISYKTKEFLIEDILDNLGLKNSQHTRCQNLSGGQRKRLSVALELVNNPPIMFLDEPTTGLDSSSTYQCVQMLKYLAMDGRTIICTIHQPSASIYEMFDHIYMMADGSCAYQGSADNTVPYLSSLGFQCPHYHNPADYFLEVVNGDYGKYTEILTQATLEEIWRKPVPKSQVDKKASLIVSDEMIVYDSHLQNMPFENPSEWTRFLILLSRCGTQLFRDWTISQLKLILHVLVGLFLGITFLNAGTDASKVVNNLGLMFCSVVYLAYTSLMPSVLKFPSELAVLKKRKVQQLIAFGLAYTSTSYFMSSQPYEPRRFFMVLVIQTLVALTSSSFGLFLGTVVNPINGTFFGAIALALMLSISGCLIIFTHMSRITYFLTYISYISFAVEGLMEAIYDFNRSPLVCPEEIEYCHYKSPEIILKDLGMDKKNYWVDVLYLLITFVLLRIVAFCTLRKKLSSA
ncbi:hypothetical protein NQ317_002056 [Molorchus minor]|uniref:ABC transporter domain-containing protein n=1 Tax=Molorchus minor TaxID=1323400 RepID=A0ABQ9JDX4_9CUCU|nr:hypothetical protein NQ317_002056 [Molorchus minor]